MGKVKTVDMTVFLGEGCLKASLFKGLRGVAFTMAEILLSLTIIGVVAAITLPSLTGNINERTWNTQRKALFARVSQAVSLMDGLRGHGTIINTKVGTPGYGGAGFGAGYSTANGAETFLSAGLSKVFKLNNICDSSHIGDCGFPTEIITLGGSKLPVSSIDTLEKFHPIFGSASSGMLYTITGPAAAFETANGESVLMHYNPVCRDKATAQGGASAYWNMMPTAVMCMNFIYDLNGKKGPNTFGKDIGFISAFYPYDPVVVAPMPASKDASSGSTWSNASNACTSQGDYRLPSFDEAMAIGLNYKIIGNITGKNYWSATPSSTSSVWQMIHNGYLGLMQPEAKSSSIPVRCIKRD